MVSATSGKTGETCQTSGVYRSTDCRPYPGDSLEPGETFPPCPGGPAATWVAGPPGVTTNGPACRQGRWSLYGGLSP